MNEEEKSYQITTIEEFVNVITPENFSNLMIDFTDMMIKITQLKKQHKKVTGEYPTSCMKSFIWNDDSFRGTKEIRFDNGETFTFKPLIDDESEQSDISNE